MTDREIDFLFRSIDNFEDFLKKTEQRKNLKLKDDIEIRFKNDPTKSVDVYLPARMLTLDNLTFDRIVSDLSREKANRAQPKSVTKDRRRDEIFELGGNRYEVYNEYIEYMLVASDVASLHRSYLNRLQELVRIFNRKNVLMIGNKQFSTRDELLEFLRSYGFKFLDKDLRFKNVC